MLQNAICLLSGLAADSLSQTAYEGSIPFARSNPTNLWKMGASGILEGYLVNPQRTPYNGCTNLAPIRGGTLLRPRRT
jgi:hypothetical protein